MPALQTSYIRIILNWLVIFTLAFHALVPAGYMPGSTDNQHAPTITICGSAGLKYVIDIATGKKIPKPGDTQEKHSAPPCSFSLNSVFSLDGMQPKFVFLFLYASLIFTMLAAFLLKPQRRYGNASSRSPPLFS